MLTDNAGYHTPEFPKTSGKLLGPNKVKASVSKRLLSLTLKDNVWGWEMEKGKPTKLGYGTKWSSS